MKDGMKILIAYDGSINSKHALEEALILAKKFSASITLLHCYWEQSEQASTLLLRGDKKKIDESGVKFDLVSFNTRNPSAEILSMAEEKKYDMIFVGSRGMGGAQAWLLGSVSSKVAAEAHVPVVVVK